MTQRTGLNTPVALFAFNRPATTLRVFEAIAAVRPARLLLVADGPRPDRPGEAEACRRVRDIMGRVDWPCEVSTNFAAANLGCQERVISGLDWVFSLVEEAIILEDDCLPDPSFFPFCHELLHKYRGDNRIAYISGCNLQEKYQSNYLRDGASYFFSQIGGIWGWATWRSEWRLYDRHLSDWPEIKKNNKLADIFDQAKIVSYWTKIFDSMHEKRGPNTWDYQWFYTGLTQNKITIVPSVNLIANIGFGKDATHTTEEDSRFMLTASAVSFPLKHPICLIPSRAMDRRRVEDMIATPLMARIARKVRRTLGSRTMEG